MLNFFIDNWFWISPIVLELGLRLFPTEKNHSLVKGIVKIVDLVVPNLKKNKEDNTVTTHKE